MKNAHSRHIYRIATILFCTQWLFWNLCVHKTLNRNKNRNKNRKIRCDAIKVWFKNQTRLRLPRKRFCNRIGIVERAHTDIYTQSHSIQTNRYAERYKVSGHTVNLFKKKKESSVVNWIFVLFLIPFPSISFKTFPLYRVTVLYH